MTRSLKQFNPDFGVPPGEILQEALEERGMSQAELAERTGRPTKTINEIIQGKTAITAETALQLERVLGVPARFWTRLEALYQEYRVKAREALDLADHSCWLDELPISSMAKKGWIQKIENPVSQVREVLNFFGVASPDVWKERWTAAEVHYRTSPTFELDAGAVSAWLRQGELLAQKIDCRPFDRDKFLEVLPTIRGATLYSQNEFEEAIAENCAIAGVAVVFVEAIQNVPVSGATRWLTPKKACIQISYRHKTDDHFWFTFFHEAGHVLLHGKRDVFIDVDDSEGVKEEEANEFANQVLFPPNSLARFLKAQDFSEAAITGYAKEIGLAPGIIVGKLQRHRLVSYESRLNRLKRKLVCRSV
ncbi:MAG: HigA family addiction module antidote protein [Candidatus Obscuribacterales bacterium]|nr:HigA family addiction module antidote protein [Candidatus Obscuribacterales bacterium]